MKSRPRRHAWTPGRQFVCAVATLLVVVGCSNADSSPATTTSLQPTSTTPPSPSTTTQPPPAACAGSGVDFDLDGVEPIETIVLADGTVVVCDGISALGSADVGSSAASIGGFVDFDGNGTAEILISDDANTLGALTVTLRGLALTDLELVRTIDTDQDPPAAPFTATTWECRDIDDDGAADLLHVAFQPADDLVNVRASKVELDGTTTELVGFDLFETSVEAAYERWSDDPRCAPDSPPRTGISINASGWGRVDFDPTTFAGDGNLILTGIAFHGGRYVAVGAEQPSPLLGEFFEPRPAIFWSDDVVSWTRADLGDAIGELRDVAVDGEGTFVAVGSDGLEVGRAFASENGVDWTAVDIAPAADGGLPFVSAVIAYPDGFAAVGIEEYLDPQGTDIDAAVWLSADGSSWQRILDPSFGTPGYQPNSGDEFNGELVDITYHPEIGLAVVGSAGGGDAVIDFPLQLPAAWLSTDGARWQRHDIDVDGRLRGVASDGTDLVAVGVGDVSGSPTSDAVVMVSADGVEWAVASGDLGDIAGVEGIQSMNDAVAVPGLGFLALGSDEAEFESRGGAAAWTSVDGATWSRAPHDDEVFGELTDVPALTMTSAAWDGAQLVVAGFFGRTIESGPGTACCVISPALWVHRPAGN